MYNVSVLLHTYMKKQNTPRTFKWINKLDVAINYRFVCRLDTALHVSGIPIRIIKSLSTAVAAICLPQERGGSSAVGRGRSYGKPEAAVAVDALMMMCIGMPETCWTVSKRQTINL
jgi:hypothetical protein